MCDHPFPATYSALADGEVREMLAIDVMLRLVQTSDAVADHQRTNLLQLYQVYKRRLLKEISEEEFEQGQLQFVHDAAVAQPHVRTSPRGAEPLAAARWASVILTVTGWAAFAFVGPVVRFAFGVALVFPLLLTARAAERVEAGAAPWATLGISRRRETKLWFSGAAFLCLVSSRSFHAAACGWWALLAYPLEIGIATSWMNRRFPWLAADA